MRSSILEAGSQTSFSVHPGNATRINLQYTLHSNTENDLHAILSSGWVLFAAVAEPRPLAGVCVGGAAAVRRGRHRRRRLGRQRRRVQDRQDQNAGKSISIGRYKKCLVCS